MRAAIPFACLDSLLIGFLAGDPSSRETLPQAISDVVRRFTGKLAPDLPRDERDEVLGQVFVALLSMAPNAYDRERGSARAFIWGVVQNAVQQIRAAYVSPGRPTRNRGRSAELHLPVRAIHEFEEHEQHELLGDTPDPVAAVEVRCDAAAMMRKAPAMVAEALRRIHLADELIEDVAADLGLSRHALRRRIAEFERQVRLAA